MVYCDESYIDAKRAYFGWGSLWSPSNRSGDLPARIQSLREKWNYHREIKWNKISDQNQSFYCDLVDLFFGQKWLMFHGLVVPRREVDFGLYPNKQAAKVYFLQLLLKTKVLEFAAPDIERKFSIIVDPLPIDYDKEHEKIEKITNAQLINELDLPHGPIQSISVAPDSRSSPGIQLCDLLLGGLLWARNGGTTTGKRGKARAVVARHVTKHLGWSDLSGSTIRQAWKFNVWIFKPKGRPRIERARDIPPMFKDIEKWRRRPRV